MLRIYSEVRRQQRMALNSHKYFEMPIGSASKFLLLL
jgi:hypothetical protein